ncbi:MAG: hypothetical protein H0Z32_11540 [Bacillaceae bacterium]|nr:hypothetical protein [Bacillaceae bacterium]
MLSSKKFVWILFLLFWLWPASWFYAQPVDESYIMEGAYEQVNIFRDQLGLNPLNQNSALEQAAEAHADYLSIYPSHGHHELEEGHKYFTGKTVLERTQYFQYEGWCMGEGITYGKASGTAGVHDLFDAPYHRLSIIHPFYEEIGAGVNQSGDLVLNFGGNCQSDERYTIVYPVPGQKQVKLSWYAAESPNPLRFFQKDRIFTGYPISFSYHSNSDETLIVKETSLTSENGEEVDSYIITPEMEDMGQHHVFFIPKGPLAPGMTYEARVEAYVTDQRGKKHDVSRDWSFQTAKSLSVMEMYLDQYETGPFLIVDWLTGKDPEAVLTLQKDDLTYLSLKGYGQTTYHSLEAGTYQLTIESPLYQEKKNYEVVIQMDEKTDNLKIESYHLLASESTKESPEDSWETIVQNYKKWEPEDSAYAAGKQWTIHFNQPMDSSYFTSEYIFVLDENGEKADVILQQEEGSPDQVNVLPPEGGYLPGASYILVIKPIPNLESINMDSGIYMPFVIETSSRG